MAKKPERLNTALTSLEITALKIASETGSGCTTHWSDLGVISPDNTG